MKGLHWLLFLILCLWFVVIASGCQTATDVCTVRCDKCEGLEMRCDMEKTKTEAPGIPVPL